ncbi:MAG: NAD(P)/FAD-dependent oxidoreductase [Pseudomonadota bacterium]
MDILVVGAGPTGLSAALMAAKLGFKPRVIERRATGSNLSRAVGLLPATMPIFARLGVLERIRAKAVEIEEAKIITNDKVAAILPLASDPDPAVRLLSLPQDRTEAILEDALAEHGVNVEYDKPFESATQEGDRVHVTMGGGERATFDEVLGADGAKSLVRDAIGVEAKGFELAEDWSIADIDVPAPLPKQIRLYLDGSHDVVFMIPLEAKRARLVSNTSDALKTARGRLELAEVRRAGAFRISVRQVDRYRVGGISLAGDAAHTHSPVGGRGMNLGIADAADWAERLAAGTLSGYSAARHVAGKHAIAFSERGRRTILGGSGTKRSLAVAAISVASRLPIVRKRLGRLFLTG